MSYQLFKLRQYLQGWINYFGIANVYQASVELDHWIRRRVRMCYWRQWRKPRTKVRNLLKRGVSQDTNGSWLWNNQQRLLAQFENTGDTTSTEQRLFKERRFIFTTRRVDFGALPFKQSLNEPPCAEPHAGWWCVMRAESVCSQL